MTRLITLALLTLASSPLLAYVGPGAGISVLGSLLGILATIVVAIAAIVLWPVRKMLKRRKSRESLAADSAAGGASEDPTTGKE
ncbi:MAG: hypothetical protein KJN94_06925 [Gammaproteobacteria bacterium]|nr:hypothetical protein [Gammaproteobacteria bacterium]